MHSPASVASSRFREPPLALHDLTPYFDRHQVPDNGRELVKQILGGDPVRRVGGGRSNVVVRYLSRKMGRVIQAESRNFELAFLEQSGRDPNIRFFFCQPTSLAVRIIDAKGPARRARTVPDYFVLHERDGFYFVECKPLSVLEKSAASSGRFIRDGSRWRWPAAEEAAAEFRFGYRVFTSDAVNLLWIRNVRYFSDFVDADCPDPERAQAVADRIAAVRSVRVHELLADTGADPQIVWWLLANGRIAADLQQERCFDLHTSWVHASDTANKWNIRHSGETAVVRNEDAPAGGTGEPEPPAGRDAPEPGDDNEPRRLERWNRRYRAFTRQDFVHYYDIGPRSADRDRTSPQRTPSTSASYAVNVRARSQASVRNQRVRTHCVQPSEPERCTRSGTTVGSIR